MVFNGCHSINVHVKGKRPRKLAYMLRVFTFCVAIRSTIHLILTLWLLFDVGGVVSVISAKATPFLDVKFSKFDLLPSSRRLLFKMSYGAEIKCELAIGDMHGFGRLGLNYRPKIPCRLTQNTLIIDAHYHWALSSNAISKYAICALSEMPWDRFSAWKTDHIIPISACIKSISGNWWQFWKNDNMLPILGFTRGTPETKNRQSQ